LNTANDVFLTINIGSSETTAIISKPKYDLDNGIDILGIGIEQSAGVNKGLITNIEDVSRTIKTAILKAKESVNEAIGTTVVSISGHHSKGLKASGAVNIPNGQVSETDINQAMQMALSNSMILTDYEIVHVIPIYFKVDDELVENPINMNGTRLEATVYIVTTKRNTLINIKSALRVFGIDDVRFALDSYTSALAVLDPQQKRVGAVVINLGASTTEFVFFKGNSILYNGFIPVGSKNITNDLSIVLQTSIASAEKIKLEYGSLLKDYSGDENLGPSKITIPRINDDSDLRDVSLDHIQSTIHVRVEETIVKVRDQLKKNALLDNHGFIIVLTGGMSKIDGIKELTKNIFGGISTSIAVPKNIPNNFRINFDELTMPTVVGLLMYTLGINRGYQLDSSKKLIRPIRRNKPIEKIPHSFENELHEGVMQNKQTTILEPLERNKKKGISSFFNKLSEWF